MLARQVAVTRPTYPHPMTVTSILIHLVLKVRLAQTSRS
jgi:hypothetical protein